MCTKRNPARPLKINALALVLMISGCAEPTKHKIEPQAAAKPSVGALGTLIPSGELRQLRPDSPNANGSQIVDQLFVKEGQKVSKGQILVFLRNHRVYQEQRQKLLSTIAIQRKQLAESASLLRRFKSVSSAGAYPVANYEQRIILHQSLLASLNNAIIQLESNAISLRNSVIYAPVSGVVTQIYSREGEAASKDGVLQIGDLSKLSAKLEVYESDIQKVRVGQTVMIRSESGAFPGQLKGIVTQVDPGIRQRTTLPTSAVPNVDVRVAVVRVAIDQSEVPRINMLVGAKLIARINP